MTTTVQVFPPPVLTWTQHAGALALAVAQAEDKLQAFAAGQVDVVIDSEGKTHLLRSAQERLRQNERRLQTVIDSLADVITVVNRSGEILSQSQAVSRVFGYESEALIGSNIFTLIHADDLRSVGPAFFDVIEGCRDEARVHFRHRMPDESFRMIEATIGKWRDGLVMNVVFCLRPASDLRAMDTPATSGGRVHHGYGAAWD
jgi:PAS domain S-box-containing protein